MASSFDDDGLFVPLTSKSNSHRDISDDSSSSHQSLECGCPRYRLRMQDGQSTVASISLSHAVVQDPSQVLESVPKHRKTAEERLFLLDVWLRRPALYYTCELIGAFIDAFSPVRLDAGQELVHQGDSISYCYVVYKGQLLLQRSHPPPCHQTYLIGQLEAGAELFNDSLNFKQRSPYSCVAVEETLLFSLSLKDLVNLTAASNEIRRGAFLDCVRAIKYFKPLSIKELHALAESWEEPMKTFDYEAGYLLQEKGAIPARLYYILSGSVELTDGRVCARRGAGQTVCAQGLLRLASPYRATVAELSTLISLEAQLCADVLNQRLDSDPDGRARMAEELRTELDQEALETAATAFAAAPDAEAADTTEVQQQQQLSLKSVHRRSVLLLCRTPQLRGLLQPTELDKLLSDKVQKATHLLVRQKDECLYAAGTDYTKSVYIVLNGELRETALDGPDGSTALLRVVRRGQCACLESLLLQSACLCTTSAYANTATTVVALVVDEMEEALGRTFIAVMKRRPETFHQCVGGHFSSSDEDGREFAFRDEVFPRDVGSSDFLSVGHDEPAFQALAVLRLVVNQIQLLMKPLGNVLSLKQLRSLRHCHRAVILGGGRGGSQFSAGDTVVTEEESRRRIICFVQSGEVLVLYSRGSRPAPAGGEKAETRPAGSLLCPEQLFLPTVCSYEASAACHDTTVALVNQHMLETAMGCEFRDVFLSSPDAFRSFLTSRYPGLSEAELQPLLAAPELSEPSESQDRWTGRVYAFGLEALLYYQRLGELFTDKELQMLRAAPSIVMPFIVERRPNQSIFLEGIDTITNLYVVYTGRVTTTVTPGPNRPKQLLETHQPGDLVGSEAFFRTGIRSTSAYAVSATELIAVSLEKLESVVATGIEEVLARDPDTMRAIFRLAYRPGVLVPRDGWRPGIDPQQLLAGDENQQQRPDGRRMRGRHLRVEAQILREAEGLCVEERSSIRRDVTDPH